MNYELAKQLKDAGFPQRSNENCDDPYVCCIHHESQEIDPVVFPTLSELIEACGNNFHSLLRGDGGTFATGDINGNVNAVGDTPEEAVAKLWLSLNKKTA